MGDLTHTLAALPVLGGGLTLFFVQPVGEPQQDTNLLMVASIHRRRRLLTCATT